MSAALADTWPAQRVVARLTGSLPMGGVVPETPVHAFAHTPPALDFRHGPRPPAAARTDIDLGGLLAFALDPVVTPAEAHAIVAASERFGFLDEAPGIQRRPACA